MVNIINNNKVYNKMSNNISGNNCSQLNDLMGITWNNELNNFRYFIMESGHIQCYSLNDLKGLIPIKRQEGILYEWDGPEDSLSGAILDGQTYFKLAYTGLFVKTPNINMLVDNQLFLVQEVGNVRIGSDTEHYGAVSGIHGRTVMTYQLIPLLNDVSANENTLDNPSQFITEYKQMSDIDLVNNVLKIDNENRYEGIQDDLYTLDEIFGGRVFQYDDTLVIAENKLTQFPTAINSCDSDELTNQFGIWYPNLDMSNIMVAGGMITQYLTSRDTQYLRQNSNDMDVFVYGLTEENATRKTKYLVDYLDKMYNIIGISLGKNCLSLILLNREGVGEIIPSFKIEIILRIYKSKSEILHGFDLGSSAVGWDGTNILFTTLSKFAYEFGCNIVDVSRRSSTYEKRIVKYSNKGFRLAMPGFDPAKINTIVPTFTSQY